MNCIKRKISILNGGKTVDINCILCKHRNNVEGCIDNINSERPCPSLSNIWHGKVLKLPIVSQIYDLYLNLQYWRYERYCEKYYISEYETQDMKFIWGVQSWDDLSPAESANLHTMNDIDVIYMKDENKYTVSIETAYRFDDYEQEKGYLKRCLDLFTKFMIENKFNVNEKLFLPNVFSYEWNINTHFDTIEECYAMFKLLVNGYCSE